MKLDQLKKVKQPEPPKPKVCLACRAFLAVCEVPIGEGSMPGCWLCAHAIVEHDCPIHEAAEHRCECTPEEIFPKSYLDLRAQREPFLEGRCPMVAVVPSDHKGPTSHLADAALYSVAAVRKNARRN